MEMVRYGKSSKPNRGRGTKGLMADFLAEAGCLTCGSHISARLRICRRCDRIGCDLCIRGRHSLPVCPDCTMILRYQARGRVGNVIDLAYRRKTRRRPRW